MDPYIIQREWSPRQLAASLAWIRMQMEVPDRGDYYSMQIAQAIRQIFSKTPDRITIESQRIPFKDQVPVSQANKDEDGCEREVIPVVTKKDIEGMALRIAKQRAKGITREIPKRKGGGHGKR